MFIVFVRLAENEVFSSSSPVKEFRLVTQKIYYLFAIEINALKKIGDTLKR